MTLGETKLKDGRIVIQKVGIESLVAYYAKDYEFKNEETLRTEIVAVDPAQSVVVFSMILKGKPRKRKP